MEKVVAVKLGVEVVQRMKNYHSVFAHRCCTESSSSASWTVSDATTIAYLSCGAYTAPCISGWPSQATSALTHSVHGLDHIWTPDRSY